MHACRSTLEDPTHPLFKTAKERGWRYALSWESFKNILRDWRSQKPKLALSLSMTALFLAVSAFFGPVIAWAASSMVHTGVNMLGLLSQWLNRWANPDQVDGRPDRPGEDGAASRRPPASGLTTPVVPGFPGGPAWGGMAMGMGLMISALTVVSPAAGGSMAMSYVPLQTQILEAEREFQRRRSTLDLSSPQGRETEKALAVGLSATPWGGVSASIEVVNALPAADGSFQDHHQRELALLVAGRMGLSVREPNQVSMPQEIARRSMSGHVHNVRSTADMEGYMPSSTDLISLSLQEREFRRRQVNFTTDPQGRSRLYYHLVQGGDGVEVQFFQEGRLTAREVRSVADILRRELTSEGQEIHMDGKTLPLRSLFVKAALDLESIDDLAGLLGVSRSQAPAVLEAVDRAFPPAAAEGEIPGNAVEFVLRVLQNGRPPLSPRAEASLKALIRERLRPFLQDMGLAVESPQDLERRRREAVETLERRLRSGTGADPAGRDLPARLAKASGSDRWPSAAVSARERESAALALGERLMDSHGRILKGLSVRSDRADYRIVVHDSAARYEQALRGLDGKGTLLRAGRFVLFEPESDGPLELHLALSSDDALLAADAALGSAALALASLRWEGRRGRLLGDDAADLSTRARLLMRLSLDSDPGLRDLDLGGVLADRADLAVLGDGGLDLALLDGWLSARALDVAVRTADGRAGEARASALSEFFRPDDETGLADQAAWQMVRRLVEPPAAPDLRHVRVKEPTAIVVTEDRLKDPTTGHHTAAALVQSLQNQPQAHLVVVSNTKPKFNTRELHRWLKRLVRKAGMPEDALRDVQDRIVALYQQPGPGEARQYDLAAVAQRLRAVGRTTLFVHIVAVDEESWINAEGLDNVFFANMPLHLTLEQVFKRIDDIEDRTGSSA